MVTPEFECDTWWRGGIVATSFRSRHFPFFPLETRPPAARAAFLRLQETLATIGLLARSTEASDIALELVLTVLHTQSASVTSSDVTGDVTQRQPKSASDWPASEERRCLHADLHVRTQCWPVKRRVSTRRSLGST